MKGIFFRFAPIIFVVAAVLLWGTAFVLEQFTDIHEGLVWMPFVFIQLLKSLICGILVQRLYRLAHKDALTGLQNRKYFFNKLADEVKAIKKNHSFISLLIMDVDNFKTVNDTYGHPIGDEVLKQIANLLKQNFRANDTVARLGGEEFAIILPNTDAQGAFAFAERIRKVIEEYRFCCDATTCNITMSIGVISSNSEESLEQLIKLADKALYMAKRIKNLVVSLDDTSVEEAGILRN